MLFLREFGPTHSSIQHQIISQSTLPSVDEIFSRVLRFMPDSSSAPVASAMVSQSSNGCGGRGRGPRGHGKSGFSPGRGRNGGRSTGSSRYCHHCQQASHTKAYCYTLHPELRPQVAYANVESPVQKVPDQSQGLPNTIMMSCDEHKSLVHPNQVVDSSTPTATLAQTSLGSSSCLLSATPTSQVVDLGATNHITGNSNLLSGITSMSPSSVTLADGSQSHIIGQGDVTLGPSLSLSSVYHLPTFPYNLLSVSSPNQRFELFYDIYLYLLCLSGSEDRMDDWWRA